MKKFIGLAAVVAAFALASCGGSNNSENTDSVAVDSVVTTTVDSVAAVDSVKVADSTSNADQAPAQEGQATEEPAQN